MDSVTGGSAIDSVIGGSASNDIDGWDGGEKVSIDVTWGKKGKGRWYGSLKSRWMG